LRALDAAQGSLELEPALSYEGTITKYSRAGVHAHTRRLDEALRLLDDCERESRAFGDTRRSLRCELVRANICVWRGNLEGAYTSFKKLLEPISKNDDLQTRGIVYNNFGQTCVRQGKFAEATEALGTAREIYVKLEMPGEIDRVDWGLAAILLATGEFERALFSLRRIREAFLKREMVEDAGLVGLDIVDALVAIDHWTEARELSEQVLAEFRHSNLDDRAVRAMAYLREFSTVSQRARAAVRHVRSYIEELREHPDEVFLPLPDVE
jgi:tetratricopeptide (TPR) repeat protein